jgi:hypothetical protein
MINREAADGLDGATLEADIQALEGASRTTPLLLLD